jgi:hypothetical protein
VLADNLAQRGLRDLVDRGEMSTLTLSRVMMPWDWIGIVTIRSDTFISRSMTGMITASPGSLTPTTLPRRNKTPFSY